MSQGIPDLPPALIERAHLGSRSALGYLFKEYSQFLLSFITKLMGSELRRTLEPADVLQETLLIATAHFDVFQGTDESELRAWLAVLARRKLVDLARHNGRLKRALKGKISLDDPGGEDRESLADLLPADQCTASQVAVKHELTGRLADALVRIGRREAAVLRMRYAEGMTLEAIGERIHVGRNGVRRLIVRALRRLRHIVSSG